MITPPRHTLEKFVTGTQFIWEDDAGQRFLSKRLGISAGTDGGAVPEFDRDSARLQNLVRFLEDIRYTLRYMNTRWWTSVNAGLISQERRELFDTRHTAEYRTGRGTFDQKGDRASPAFVPAAQQDLITLTLEILARDSVANAATSQREAFRGAYKELSKEALVQTSLMGQEGIRAVRDTQAQAPEGLELEAVARVEVQVVDSFEVAKSALKPVLQSLQMDNMPASHGDPPSQILVLPVVATDSTDSRQASAGAGSARKPSPLSTEGVPSLQYSISSNSAGPSSANRDPDPSSRAGVLV
ncbi:hypothetical protein EDB89DRAFT_2018453 [Lactarius sanguifluus]|nr:hypothetical protein EDB89DRAFT_2018453 [Lactarius sanguifluus]